MPAVLFVCLGNICRSPLAEGAFRAEAARVGLEVRTDSAGTGGWHRGEPPNTRAQAVARRHGLDISDLRARKIEIEDFRRFTHILALDRNNLRDLKALQPKDATASLSLLLDHVSGHEGQSIADPYYGDDDDFERTFEEVTMAARSLAAELLR